MKLSVLAICYNHEKYVAQAIESILAQRTDFDFEIIVGDDCSTDSSAQILFSLQQKFPDKLKVIVNEKNLGPHRNFERVFNAAQGEYIALLETDDFWCDPLKLLKQVTMLDSDSSLALCFTNAIIIDDNGFVVKEDRVPPENRRRLTQRDIISGYCPPTNTVVFRHSAMPVLPPEYFKCLNGDFVIYIHMTEKGDVGYIDEKTAYYRKHDKGIWSNKSQLYVNVNFAKTCQVLLNVYRDKYSDVLVHHIFGCYDNLLKFEVEQFKNNSSKIYAGDIPDLPEYDGWIGLSLTRQDDRHIKHDIRNPLPFANNSVDVFQAEDVFEHIAYERLPSIINEVFRILKPGALFRLSVPDYGCDILQQRSIADASGNIVFDPDGGGTLENPGHVWFPRYGTVKAVLESSMFSAGGKINFLHYYDSHGNAVTHSIDYSKGHIQRTPDFDPRVQFPYRPMSIVVDLEKGTDMVAARLDTNNIAMNPVSNGNLVKISFVMIVLNGMPFVEYALKAIYDEAHEIIIVEGAVESCAFAANPDGSSVDGTVECIKSFPDPYRKIRLIQGRWPEKCEMQNAALEHVSGNYVWLVDSDEIYKSEDLGRVRSLLANDPTITQVNFIPDNFWKGFDYLFVSSRFFEPANHYRRLFKFKPGSRFTTHRPPTMVWPGSEKTTEQIRLIDGLTTRQMGIIPFHYSYVLESQVRQKIELYRRYGWGEGWRIDLEKWYREFFQRWTPENSRELERLYPIWTGDPNSSSVPFTGTHPEIMNKLIAAYHCGELSPQSGSAKTVVCATDEQDALATVGAVKYQKMVLDAWSHVELDAPLLIRKECMENHIENGSPFWNIHVALAFVASRFQPRSYLEIGVRTGASMVQVLHNSTPDRVTGVDLWAGNYSSLPNNREFTEGQLARYQRETGRLAAIELIQGDSHLVLKNLIVQGHKYDLITVDGDHSDQGAMEDLEDAYQLLNEKGIIVFDDIIHPSFKSLLVVIREFVQRHPDLHLVLNTTQDNGVALLLRGVTWGALKGFRIAGEGVVGTDLTQIQDGSDFETSLRGLVLSIMPRAIIETGTYLGKGTTRIIATALRDAGLSGTMFYSIECNPSHHQQACSNLGQAGLLPYVKPLLGLSVPRSILPTVEKIHDDTVSNMTGDDIFVDHQEQNRVALYYRETDYPNIPEDLLGTCLEQFGGRPDLVLLDSAGHMGNVEFNYVIERIKGECYLILDDIRHIKHYQSFQQLQQDPRFTVIRSSDEKFGFCIAKFNPADKVETTAFKKRVLWIRTDSIGDNILSMSMLPHLKTRRPDAEITVLCQDHIAELYETCPEVDGIITFNRARALEDENYRIAILNKLKGLNADICLNSVYSREMLTDLFAIGSGARERIAIQGDCCNISQDSLTNNNRYYTSIISQPGEHKSELERHQDFLNGLGITCEHLEPALQLNSEDMFFCDRFFEQHGLVPERTVALFAGTQYGVRSYDKYGVALDSICKERGLSVVALGSSSDYSINQYSLEAIATDFHNLSGTTTLRQSAAIISRCRLAVGAETGLAHIACAVGTPNVILLGGGHFGRFMPYSPLTSVVCLPLECYGCNWECRFSSVHCVRDIAPSVIESAIRQTLHEKSSVPRIFVQDASLWEHDNYAPQWLQDIAKFLGNTNCRIKIVT